MLLCNGRQALWRIAAVDVRIASLVSSGSRTMAASKKSYYVLPWLLVHF